MRTSAFRAFTHDLRPPIQGGQPVWGGQLPFSLPAMTLDASSQACGAGWHASPSIEQVLKIVGMWPDGRPSRVFCVETDGPVINPASEKFRAATWDVVSEVDEEHVGQAIRQLAAGWFHADHVSVMSAEQILWRRALARPLESRDEALVESDLLRSLEAKSLPWKLKRFDSVRAARAAWDAWAAWAARAARAAWDVWDAWAARAARAAWDVWDAWDARAARAAWDAWDARAALQHQYAVRMSWISGDPEKLTTGIRDAYLHGLAIVLPTGPDELGWSMDEEGASK